MSEPLQTKSWGNLTVNFDEVPVYPNAVILGRAMYYDWLNTTKRHFDVDALAEKGIELAIHLLQGLAPFMADPPYEKDVEHDFRVGMSVADAQVILERFGPRQPQTLNFSEIGPMFPLV